jgi:hypothetical protein
MNQYRCETCKNCDCQYYSYTPGEPGCTVIASKHDFTANKGCASHSDFQSEWDKIQFADDWDAASDEFLKLIKIKTDNQEFIKIAEQIHQAIRQQAGDRV